MSKYGFDSCEGYYYNMLRESTGALPLHDAAKNGQVYIVNCLSDEQANLEAVDNNGRTALHYAAIFNRREVYDILVEKGANFKLKDAFGLTPEYILDSIDTQEVQITGESCSWCILQ